ncbi:MAG: MFS transporter [Patescibacteria group bacterium]|nr:MFS transporter [Patescibacteria group bacterium]
MIRELSAHINNKKSLTLLYLLGTILAVANALPTYIQSSFLATTLSISWVSVFFAGANFITIISILFFPRLIKKLGNIITTQFILVIFIFSLLGMSLASGPVSLFVAFLMLSVSSNLIWINMDILVENFSDNATTGITRTIYFTAINLGWIIAPTLSSYIINNGGYYWVFIAAAACLVPFLIILIKNKAMIRYNEEYQAKSIKQSFKALWNNKNLRGIFFIAFLLNIFISSAVVYIPFYLHNNLGFDWSTLGIMFSVMLLPFIIFEIPAGWLADKYLGEKEIMTTGITIIIIALILFFSVKELNPWIWGGILFFSRIGASLVEAMRETYFFKIVDAQDVSYINFFRITAPLGILVGTIVAGIIINFYPLEYLFLFVALIMSSAYVFIYSIKDTL